MSARRLTSLLGAALLVVVATLLGASWLEVRRGEHALGEAERARERGELMLEIATLRVAAEAKVPYFRHHERAYQRLEQIATEAEHRRDDATARLARSVSAQAASSTGDQLRLARVLAQQAEGSAQPSPPATGHPRGPRPALPIALGGLGVLGVLAALLWMRRGPASRPAMWLVAGSSALMVVARLLA